jgi:hypothetical protein
MGINHDLVWYTLDMILKYHQLVQILIDVQSA